MPVHIAVELAVSRRLHTDADWRSALRRLHRGKPGCFEYFYPRHAGETLEHVRSCVTSRLYAALDDHKYMARTGEGYVAVSKQESRASAFTALAPV
jgi:hypothetical protein